MVEIDIGVCVAACSDFTSAGDQPTSTMRAMKTRIARVLHDHNAARKEPCARFLDFFDGLSELSFVHGRRQRITYACPA